MKRSLVAGLLLMATSSLFLGATANPKISPDLQNLTPGTNVTVVVQYTQAPVVGSSQGLLGSLVGSLTGTLTGVADLLPQVTLLGGVVNLVSGLLNVVVCTLPAQSVTTLANNPNVVYISLDRPVAARLDYTAAAVNASKLWQSGLTGAGVGVAVIDSGVQPKADLALLGLLSRIVYEEDFTGGTGGDPYGHGTHVAGIVGANGWSSDCLGCNRPLVGMAPGASIIDLRVLDQNGVGTDSAVIAALEQAVALKNQFNIRVINLSLGRPVVESSTLDPLGQAVEAAWKAGIVVVVAAGNDGRDNSEGNNGYGTIESPGNDPYAITVGAMRAMDTYTRTDDLIASYSSKGPSAIDHYVKPDVVAPGNQVVSLESQGSTLAQITSDQVPMSYYIAGGSGAPSTSFLMLNGTSMATAVVTGVVADLLQAHPALTPDQVKARLMKTAYKTFPTTSTAVDPTTGESFVSEYDVFTVGAGYLDAAAALANTDAAGGTAMSPVASFNSATGNVTMTFDASSTWNNAGVWGAQIVWGPALINTDGTFAGMQSAYGPNTSVSAERVMWGTSGLWATRVMWGTGTASADRVMWGTDTSTTDSNTQFTVNQ